MENFNLNDTVYTQDGTEYVYDHTVGEWAFCAPIILIQITSYSGYDFTEEHEPADHMVRLRRASISKKPWIKKVHAETAEAVAEKKAKLDALNIQIGAARTELRLSEEALVKRGKELETESRSLERRYQYVRDLKRIIGDETVFILAVNGKIPCIIPRPDTIVLKRNGDKYAYSVPYYDDDPDRVLIFKTEAEREFAVINMFTIAEKSVEDELDWNKRFPFLELSTAAYIIKEEREKDINKKKLEKALTKLDAAQKEVMELTT